jgi:ABC-type nickel/cobalt efflux system permease component RcnA
MTLAVLMAQADDTVSVWSGPGSTAKEIVVAIGIMSVVVLLIFIWAAFWRKPRRHKHSYHHPDAALPRREKRKPRLFGRRHRRHHRKDDHPMNPTLAQVGGLPPERRDRPPTH